MLCQLCGFTDRHYLRSEEVGWNFICPECHEGMYVIHRRSMNGHANFQPFVTDEYTGEPEEYTSAKHRDQVLEANHLTLDKVSDIDRRKERHLKDISAAAHVTFDTVMTALKKSRGEWSE